MKKKRILIHSEEALSKRIRNALNQRGFKYIDEIENLPYKNFILISGLGPTSVNQIMMYLGRNEPDDEIRKAKELLCSNGNYIIDSMKSIQTPEYKGIKMTPEQNDFITGMIIGVIFALLISVAIWSLASL